MVAVVGRLSSPSFCASVYPEGDLAGTLAISSL